MYSNVYTVGRHFKQWLHWATPQATHVIAEISETTQGQTQSCLTIHGYTSLEPHYELRRLLEGEASQTGGPASLVSSSLDCRAPMIPDDECSHYLNKEGLDSQS